MNKNYGYRRLEDLFSPYHAARIIVQAGKDLFNEFVWAGDLVGSFFVEDDSDKEGSRELSRDEVTILLNRCRELGRSL